MDTWPNLFIKDQTYIDYKWDLSDFEDKLDYYVQHPRLCIDIGQNSQRIYKNLLTTEHGFNDFCKRFKRLIT